MKKISHFLVMLVAAAITVLGTACSNSASTPSTPTYLGTKAPSEAKAVGDIVFNDGSAMPYSAFDALDDSAKNAKKAAAIALIFYKGTGLNSGDDTTTSRTLGVGLKHSNDKLIWCKDLSDAYKTNIETIQCLASTSASGLTFTGDRNGSNNFEQIKAILKASGKDDGPSQFVNSVFEFAKNYSSTASNLGETYKDDWYLPSCAELFQIYACRADTTNGFDIDAASEALGGDKFGSKVYWSSSQSDYEATGGYYNCVYRLLFETGELKDRLAKNNKFYACCVREF